jgi:hypothetical protein
MSKTNKCLKCKGVLGGTYDLQPIEFMCTCESKDWNLYPIGVKLSFTCPACGELGELPIGSFQPMIFLCKGCLEFIGQAKKLREEAIKAVKESFKTTPLYRGEWNANVVYQRYDIVYYKAVVWYFDPAHGNTEAIMGVIPKLENGWKHKDYL